MMKQLEIAAEIDHMLTELQQPRRAPTAWELDFLASVTDQFNRRGFLTEKQLAILRRIYQERTE